MNILIYLDSESYNHPPVLMGRMIASATEGNIDVLIVVPESGHLENGEAVKEQVLVDLDGLSPEIIIKQGVLGEMIKEQLSEKQYQLVIANADRVQRFRKSVDVDPVLLKQTSFSLLLTQNTKPKIDQILLCSCCRDDDFSLINQATSLAGDLKASVTLLHVISGSVPSMYTGLDQIDETVEELLQTDTPVAQYLRKSVEILMENNIESEVKIRRGIPIEEIIRETQLVNHDLVVIGSSKVNQGLKEMLMGNMTRKIIDQVELPVLIIGTRDLGC
jgi:nucleotide-binding universal stress UspA family protein